MISISSKESLDLHTLVQRLREQMPPILRARPIHSVYLYGSAAMDSTSPMSDIDIALISARPLTSAEHLNTELDVQAELAHRVGIRRADVRIVNAASLLLRGEVVNHGILLYAQDDNSRIAFETGTRREYLDFKPLAHRVRAALLARRKPGGYMVNREKVERLLQQQQEYLKHLRKLAQTDVEQFLADPDKTGAAKYYLLVVIETCIDIGSHIISAERFRAPTDYADVFTVLGENKVFSEEFTRTLEKMAGFRNRLVHAYTDVDDRLVHEYLRTRLDDFTRFQDQILNFVSDSSEPN